MAIRIHGALSRTSSLLRAVFVAAVVLTCIQSPVVAADGIRIEAAWARATPPGTPMGAAYLTIVNVGDAPDRLVGAATPVAERVQLHRSVEVEGESRMRRQSGGVPVPAGARVRFAPGSYHVMLMGLAKRLEAGARVPLTLEFERAGRIRVEVEVRPLDWTPDEGD